jgi:DNA-binding NtrC family response regulator
MPEKQKSVLILEDEPIISKVLSRTFKADGFEVDTAENGAIAKAKIDTRKHYDLFIFDIRTPILSGIQLFELLEKEYPDLTEKVIFMTGDSLNTATSQFLQRINRPYLMKPFTPTQIQSLVKRTIKTKA